MCLVQIAKWQKGSSNNGINEVLEEWSRPWWFLNCLETFISFRRCLEVLWFGLATVSSFGWYGHFACEWRNGEMVISWLSKFWMMIGLDQVWQAIYVMLEVWMWWSIGHGHGLLYRTKMVKVWIFGWHKGILGSRAPKGRLREWMVHVWCMKPVGNGFWDIGLRPGCFGILAHLLGNGERLKDGFEVQAGSWGMRLRFRLRMTYEIG